MAEDGDTEASVQEAAQGGPQGAGQWLHRGTEAQHGPCKVGVLVRPGGSLSVTTPAAHFLDAAEASPVSQPSPFPPTLHQSLQSAPCGPLSHEGATLDTSALARKFLSTGGAWTGSRGAGPTSQATQRWVAPRNWGGGPGSKR